MGARQSRAYLKSIDLNDLPRGAREAHFLGAVKSIDSACPFCLARG